MDCIVLSANRKEETILRLKELDRIKPQFLDEIIRRPLVNHQSNPKLLERYNGG